MKLQSGAKQRRDSQGEPARWAGNRQGAGKGRRVFSAQRRQEVEAQREKDGFGKWRAQPSSARTWLSEKRVVEERVSACFKG